MSDNINNGCSSNCSSCASSGSCSSKKVDIIAKPHYKSSIKNVIGVVSGKGGVGKSLVTSSLAVLLRRKGYNIGILDADITGPSIPKAFGIREKPLATEEGIYPQKSRNEIKIMSINILLDKEDTPVIWRGPVIATTVKQFYSDVVWEDTDVLFLDMPPGTGDVPLTVYQSLPLNGIIIVTTPQDLVSMIVKKAYNMAKMMNVPVLGVVENMSYVKCPDCNKEIKLFGESRIDEISGELGLKVLGKLPIDPKISYMVDNGKVEKINFNYLDDGVDYLENKLGLNK